MPQRAPLTPEVEAELDRIDSILKEDAIETKVIQDHTVNITKDKTGMYWANIPSIPDRSAFGKTVEEVTERIEDEIDAHYELEKECQDLT